MTALVARDRRLLKLPLQLQKSGAANNNSDAPDTVRLNVGNAELAKHWLREDQPTQQQAKPKV